MLVEIVSSRMLTDMSSMRTMSGLASEVLMLVGIVAGGESDALHLGISAYRWTDAGSSFLTLERRPFKLNHASMCAGLGYKGLQFSRFCGGLRQDRIKYINCEPETEQASLSVHSWIKN